MAITNQPVIRKIPSIHSAVATGVNGKDHSDESTGEPLTVGEAAAAAMKGDPSYPRDEERPLRTPEATQPKRKKPGPEQTSERQFSARADGEDFFDWIAGFDLQDWEKDYLAIYKMTPNRHMVDKVNGPVDEAWLEENIVPQFGAGVYQIQLRARSGKHKNDFIKLELGDIREQTTSGNQATANRDNSNQGRGMGPRTSNTVEAGFSQVMRDVSSAHLEASKTALGIVKEQINAGGNGNGENKLLLELMKSQAETQREIAKAQAESQLAIAKLQSENALAIARMQSESSKALLEAERSHHKEMLEVLEKKEQNAGLGVFDQVAKAFDAMETIKDALGGTGGGEAQPKGWLGFAQSALQSPALQQIALSLSKLPMGGMPATPAVGALPQHEPSPSPAAAPPGTTQPPSAATATPPGWPFPFSPDQILQLVGRLQAAIYNEQFDEVEHYSFVIDVEYPAIAGWIRQTDTQQVVQLMQADPRGQALFATPESQKFVGEILEEIKKPAEPAKKKAAKVH